MEKNATKRHWNVFFCFKTETVNFRLTNASVTSTKIKTFVPLSPNVIVRAKIVRQLYLVVILYEVLIVPRIQRHKDTSPLLIENTVE